MAKTKPEEKVSDRVTTIRFCVRMQKAMDEAIENCKKYDTRDSDYREMKEHFRIVASYLNQNPWIGE